MQPHTRLVICEAELAHVVVIFGGCVVNRCQYNMAVAERQQDDTRSPTSCLFADPDAARREAGPASALT